MFNSAKTISYNHNQQAIHIFFFDRDTARKFELAMIPYKGMVHRVRNVHGPDTGSVWDRQLDRDGVRTTERTLYEVKMYNITRFMDIGRLTAYLQKNIVAEIEMEDLDGCTPNSKTSTLWKLTVKTAGCPEFLRGIVRIMWFGITIILKHPNVGQRLPCFKCGHLGHVMARCQYTQEQLAGQGSRVAKESDIADLEDLAKPFATLEEIKQSATQRLLIQEVEEKEAQEAVKPTPFRKIESHQRNNVSEGKTKDQPRSTVGVEPTPKKEWVTVPLGGGRKLYGHKAALQQRGIKTDSRFTELADDSEPGDEEGIHQVPEKPQVEVTEISSGSSQEDQQQSEPSKEEKSKLRLIRRKPAGMPSIPMLLTLKQRERSKMEKILQPLAEHAAGYVQMEQVREVKRDGFRDLETILGLKEVNTPSSGNCMAMALAQAVANYDLAANDEVLEQVTASIKNGIKVVGLMNMEEQFDHYTRVHTLVNVRRGWKQMSPKESRKQLRWFLEEYAATPSTREALVEQFNWGCSELMTMATNFLQRSIFVLAFDVDGKRKWNCSLFKPSTTSKGTKVFETGQQVILTISECISQIRAEKCKDQRPPLVLRFWGNHYSAFVHQLVSARLNRKERESSQEEKMTYLPEEQENQDQEMENAEENELDSTKGDSQEPWDPTLWCGDVEELNHKPQGLSIPHELKREIYYIMTTAPVDKYAELLTFLVNTASQLTRGEGDRLLHLPLDDEANHEVIGVLQKYQISRVVLRQWRDVAQQEAEASQQMDEQLCSSVKEESEEEFVPASDGDVVCPQLAAVSMRRETRSATKNQKRAHSTTPMEAEKNRQTIRSKKAHQPNSEGEIMCDDAQTAQRLPTRQVWPEMWQEMAAKWPQQAGAAFPSATSGLEVWELAVKQEPALLLNIVQGFPFADEVLAGQHSKVMITCTANWRKECLLAGLQGYREKTSDTSTQKWIDDWKVRIENAGSESKVVQVDRQEDWKKLKAQGYGHEAVLQLCEVINKYRLAQHVLCAKLYAKQIQILTGHEDIVEPAMYDQLRRHLRALRSIKLYADAFYAENQMIDWFGVERFFSKALERGDVGVLTQH